MAYSPKPPLSETIPDGPAPAGDDLHAWVLRYGPALRRYFARRADAADVDDLVQEVFLMMQSRGGAACEIENVEGYLFRTAANVLGQRRRRATWRWGRQEEVEAVDGLADELSPERILIGREAFEAMMQALEDLPPRSALAFMLFRLEHMPQQAIARRMGISVRAVQALIQRAANRIHERMGWRP